MRKISGQASGTIHSKVSSVNKDVFSANEQPVIPTFFNDNSIFTVSSYPIQSSVDMYAGGDFLMLYKVRRLFSKIREKTLAILPQQFSSNHPNKKFPPYIPALHQYMRRKLSATYFGRSQSLIFSACSYRRR